MSFDDTDEKAVIDLLQGKFGESGATMHQLQAELDSKGVSMKKLVGIINMLGAKKVIHQLSKPSDPIKMKNADYKRIEAQMDKLDKEIAKFVEARGSDGANESQIAQNFRLRQSRKEVSEKLAGLVALHALHKLESSRSTLYFHAAHSAHPSLTESCASWMTADGADLAITDGLRNTCLQMLREKYKLAQQSASSSSSNQISLAKVRAHSFLSFNDVFGQLKKMRFKLEKRELKLVLDSLVFDQSAAFKSSSVPPAAATAAILSSSGSAVLSSSRNDGSVKLGGQSDQFENLWYRFVPNQTSPTTFGLSTTPCFLCPKKNHCKINFEVSPENCPYFDKMLSF